MATRATRILLIIVLVIAIGIPAALSWILPYVGFAKATPYLVAGSVLVSVFIAFWLSTRLLRGNQPTTPQPTLQLSQENKDAIFEAIFNNTFQFTGLLEPSGKMIEANQTALDFADTTLEKVRGQFFWETHWWCHDPAAQKRVKEAIAKAGQGEFVRYDDVVQDGQHNLITIDFSLRPIFNEAGEVTLLIPEGRDIQEQVNIRAALEESETRFRTMVNSARIGVTLMAADGSVVYGNDFIRDLLGGFSQQDFTSINVADYTHPDDLEHSYEKIQELQSGKVDAYHITKRFITRKKEVIWVALSVSAVRSNTGNLKYVLSLAQDITRQKEMEQELQNSERKYRTLVEQSPIAYVIHQDGKIVFANPKAIELSGLENEEDLIGQDMLAFVSDPFKEVARERMQRMMETHQAEAPMKQVLVNVKGEEYVVEVIPNPIIYNGRLAVQLVINDITIQEKAKQQVEKSEFVLRNAEKIAQVGSWEWNLTTNEAIWSEMMHEIMEWPQEEGAMHHEKVFALIHPDDLPAVQQVMARVLAKQTGEQVEYRLLLPSGRVKHVEARNMVINGDESQPISLIGTIQDVTDRKQAEIELEDSRKQLKNITDSIPGTVLRYVLLPDGTDKLTFISKGAEDVWGVTVEEAMEDVNNLWKHIPADYIADMRVSIENSARTLTEWKHEWPVHLDNGQKRWILGLGVPTKSEDGSVVWDTINLDITQQKEAEQAMLESEQRYKSLFQNNLAGVYQIDLQDQLKVISCNRAFAEIIGLPDPSDVIGKSVNDLFESERNNNYYDKIMAEGRVINWESHLRLHDGRTIQTLENSTVLEVEGEPKYIEGTVFDISKLKSAESERIRLIEQLTFQNKNLEEFAYIVSHNLRSPVAALLGLTHLAANNKENTELLDQVLDRMRLSAEELDTIIKDLNVILTAKRDSGQEKEWVDLHKLLQSVINLQKHDIDLVGGEVVIDLGGIDSILAVKGYLHNIFFNLIGNGFKYRSPDRPPKVEVLLNKKGNRIQIEVRDNGVGINIDQFGNRLFNLYQRFHNHVEGRGIGLYLVRSQVENMGGHITVESEVNKGTSFYIYLDVEKVQPKTKETINLGQDKQK